MSIEEELPPQVTEILREMEKIIDLDPIDGTYILVGQNGTLERTKSSRRGSFLSSCLVDADKVSEVLSSIDYPGNILHDLGHPSSGERNGETFYEVAYVNRGLETIEPFVIEQVDPTNSVFFLPRQDLQLFYSLFIRGVEGGFNYDDHLRGVNDVIKYTHGEYLGEMYVLKSYLLDYLYQRKKALLIGYFCDISVPSSLDIPEDFRKTVLYNKDHMKATILVLKDRFLADWEIYARLDMWKVVLPPKERTLGHFGVAPAPPSITVKTRRGEVNLKDIDIHAMESFFTAVYFRSEVLKRYENDQRYRIDDDGGVYYSGVWGIFRGIYRLSDEIIATNISDLFGSLPYEEWSHWAAHNIEPLSIEEHRKLRDKGSIPVLINTLAQEMEQFDLRLQGHLTYLTGTLHDRVYGSTSDKDEQDMIKELKKVFTRQTDRNEFLNRIVVLNKLLVDRLKGKSIARSIDVFDPDAKFDDQKQPKASLKLLLAILEYRLIYDSLREAKVNERDMPSKAKEYFRLLWKQGAEIADDYLYSLIKPRIDELRDKFSVLFTIYALRSKGGGAHPISEPEFGQAMESLGFSHKPSEYLQVYHRILNRLIDFFQL